MSYRAVLALFISMVVIALPISVVTTFLSKRTGTDLVLASPFYGYGQIVLRQEDTFLLRFNAYQPNSQRRSCVAWYSDGALHVQYRVVRMDTTFLEVAWQEAGTRDSYWPGWGSYQYLFGRASDQHVHIFYTEESPPDRCGYQGSAQPLRSVATPIDVFTDILGLARIESYYESDTAVPLAEREPPQNAEETVAERADRLTRTMTTLAILEAQGEISLENVPAQHLRLNQSQWEVIQHVLWRGGYYDGEIDGIIDRETTLSIRMWQLDNDFFPSGIVGLAELQTLVE